MTAVNPPWVIQASSHPADVFRRQTRLLAQNQQGILVSTLSGTGLQVTANGSPNMTVNVAAGEAIVNGTQNFTSQGAYTVLNDATVNLSIAAADPTNPRIDIVVAQVQDAAYSGSTNAWSLAVITGTPAPSPSPPATPNNALVLAQVAVAANATSIVSGNITDKRLFFGTQFQASVFQNTAQSIPNNVSTKVTYDSIEYDNNGNYSTVNSQYTCPIGGRYRVEAWLLFSGPTGTVNPIYMQFVRNASVYRRVLETQVTGSGAPANPNVGGGLTIKANFNDTLEIHVVQISGAGYNTLNGSEWSWAQFSYLGQ